jgi:hypothetical protein
MWSEDNGLGHTASMPNGSLPHVKGYAIVPLFLAAHDFDWENVAVPVVFHWPLQMGITV